MKTKITSLLAITLAATTFFSCSNEIETPENGQMLNPGDAQISIGLGNGATTYSTIALEKLIKDGSGKLFKTDGSEITMTDPKIATVAGVNKFTATVPASSFTEGEAAKLYLYVNGTPSSTVTTGTAEARFAASTVSTVISRELPNGLPAGFGPATVTLKSGIITAPVTLKRAAARVGAVSTSTAITGYTVTLNNVNTTSGAIFTTPVAIAANGKVERKLNGVTADMFGSTETVGYVYPSVSSTVTVTPITGAPITVPFAPKAGKNYTVKITPSGNDGVFDGDVTIVEWEADGEIDADFGGGTVITDYIKEISIPLNGLTWMPFGPTGDAAIDQATAKAIYETAGNTNAEKLVAYAYASEANYRMVQGAFFRADGVLGHCPKGYRIARVADYTKLTDTAIPLRGIDITNPSALWLAKGVDTQDFTNVTLNRVPKAPAITGGMDWYSEFTDKTTGVKFPFIGTTYHGTLNTNQGGTHSEYKIFTGELRNGARTRFERIVIHGNGWENNDFEIFNLDFDRMTSVVRCVVEIR